MVPRHAPAADLSRRSFGVERLWQAIEELSDRRGMVTRVRWRLIAGRWRFQLSVVTVCVNNSDRSPFGIHG
jgi:hypothetical protein